MCLCLADMIGGDWPKGEQTLSVPHGCTTSHRLFPPCVCVSLCVVSLEQEIIRFKPQKRRIKGGRGGRWRGKKVVVFCAEWQRERGVADGGTQKGSLNEGK